jgi:hypothetical protein
MKSGRYNKAIMKKVFIAIFCLILLVLAGCGAKDVQPASQPTEGQILVNSGSINEAVVIFKEKVKDAAKASAEAVEEVVAEVKSNNPQDGLPATFDQPMAFSRQAPFGNWDAAHEETCEEASLVIVDKFFKGLPLDEKIMDEELNKVIPREKETFGFFESTNTEETARLAREYFKLNAEVSSEVTVERIKKELVAGNLIILPLAGREVHNPNYTGEGPLYHMLVVRGYDRDQFITNDPGTRKGQGYKYKYQVLLDATHDWNGGDIYKGEKMMIVIKNKN